VGTLYLVALTKLFGREFFPHHHRQITKIQLAAPMLLKNNGAEKIAILKLG
jgi:hypothetical protein